tara:strand:+ start:853 stop:3999 length:3147 start_codon:yes stop_codon:yes gene_type:complete
MAGITQTIPTYWGGISEQPDELKKPGQVTDAINVLPDVTQGLLKRPGSKLIGGNLNSSLEGKWFSYYRDKSEQYIGQVARDGDIKMWRCSDGFEMTVTQDAALKTYLVHTADDNIQTLTLNDFTFITNRLKTTAMSSTVETVRPAEAFIELKRVAYASQYAVNLFDDNTTQAVTTATRLSIKSKVLGNDSLCPNVGTDIFKETAGVRQQWKITGITRNTATNNEYLCTDDGDTTYTLTYDNPSGSDITLTTVQSTGDLNDVVEGWTVDEDYDDLPFVILYISTTEIRFVFKEVGANAIAASTHTVLLDNGRGETIGGASSVTADGTLANHVTGNSTDATTKKDLYFRLTTTGQAVPSDAAPSDVTYSCRYTTVIDLLHGGEGWAVDDEITVVMKSGLYTIKVEEISTANVQANLGLIRPTPTSFDAETTVTAESILGALQTDIIAANATWDTANIEIIGNGIYIKRDVDTVFNISTPVGELLNVFTNEIKDIAELPSQCKHGYVVKIANSEADEDDYYVKFIGKQKADGTYLDGDGVWEECPQPGVKTTFDASTMPIQLVRTSATEFTVSTIDWDPRQVGDTTTVPEPSFIGKTIHNLLFYRNRLIMLSDENVILSRPGDFFNFWPKSAITYTATDVIDLSVSSEYPAIVYDGISVNAGIVLFTPNKQFMLTTDSDVLSPLTAKINSVANYNFNFSTNPFSLGTSVGFLDNAGANSRFFEMTSVLREGEPVVVDQSKQVPNLLPKDLTLVADSRENSIIVFGTKDKDVVYGYRYFNTSNQRVQASWFKWKFSGDVQYHCMLDDAYFLVVRNGTSDVIQRIDIASDPDDITSSITADDVTYRIHLDNYSFVRAPVSYDANTDLTTFTLPNGYSSGNTLAAYYATDDIATRRKNPNQLGAYAVATQVTGDTFTVPGDFTTGFYLGYLFDMEVKLPNIYVQQQIGDGNFRSDIQSSLIIHRVKLSLNHNGTYTSTLKRLGRSDYTQTFEAITSNLYTANTVGFKDTKVYTIPVYDRNTNVTIDIKSSNPSPATLNSLSWEGDYSSKFYKRV